MTAYNREKYIAEAIESVLTSTYRNFELIIVDDASTDSTVKIAREYEKKYPRIRLYVNEKNLGDYPNRNRAVSYAKGEYVMFVDSDDTINQNGIEKCVNTMDAFSECGFGLIHHDSIGGNAIKLESKEALCKHFFEKPFLQIGPGGTISRLSSLNEIGGYPELYGPANDMYFNLKIASVTSVVLIPFLFVNYRIHDGQEAKNKYSYLYNNYNYLRDALEKLNLPLSQDQKKWIGKKNKRRFALNISKYLLKTLNFRKTTKAIQLAEFKPKDFLTAIFQ